MRQYLMQPRRCGAADLRAWRIDRKRPSDLVLASLGIAHFTVRKPILGETACVPQCDRLRRRTKAFGESSKSQLPLSAGSRPVQDTVVRYDNSTSPYFTLL